MVCGHPNTTQPHDLEPCGGLRDPGDEGDAATGAETPQQVCDFVAEAMSEDRATKRMAPIEPIAGAIESGWLALQDLLHASES